MKRLLALVFLALPITGFAMSCPTNGSIIDQGDTLQEVLQRCGTPDSQREFTRLTSASERHESYYIVNDLQANKDTYSVSRTIPQEVVKLSYAGSRSSQNNTMIFINDKLVHWY
jgi:hypothetical protein